jgi:predicted deacylase
MCQMNDQRIVFPAPGTTERRLLRFDAGLLAEYAWPYFAINGAYDGPTVCLIAGIHGAEYPPIDAVMRFCRALDPGHLHGRVIGVPVVNLPAFWERTPFVCPRDGKNPNRVFPGTPDGTFSEVLAFHFFETVIRRGDYLIDLHCGDLVEDLLPFSLIQQSGDAVVDARALDLAQVFGLPNVIVQARAAGPIAGTTNGAAAAAGIPALIAEAGGIGQLEPEAVEMHLHGLQRVFQRLEMLEGAPLEPLPTRLIRDFVWVRAERGGFFRKAIAAGDSLAAGDPLGEMVDLWGEPIATIPSPTAGVVLFVTTSPAIKDDGLLVGIGVPA